MEDGSEKLNDRDDIKVDINSAYTDSESRDELMSGTDDDSNQKKDFVANSMNYFERVNTVNNVIDSAALTAKELIMDYKAPRDIFNWKKIITEIQQDEFNAKLSTLKKQRVLFVSSANFPTTTSLVHHISSIAELKIQHKKEVFFNHPPSKKTFGLADVISLCLANQQNILIVAKLEDYLKNEFEKAFFNTLIKQQHNNFINSLTEKNIFFVVAITKSLAADMVVANDESEESVWMFELSGLEQNKIPELDSFFNGLNPLQKVFTFIASFFRNLSFRDFRTVAQYLLASISKEEYVVVEKFKDFSDGAKKVKQVSTFENPATWEAYHDAFLNECYLEGRFEGGKFVIDFVADGLRENLKKFFLEKQHYFWQKQFEILDKAALLFNPAINEAIVENLTDLVVESIKADSAYYDNQWLFNKLYTITDLEGKPLLPESTERSFASFWKPVQSKSMSRFFYTRLTGILVKMYQRSLTSEAEYFLNSLINAEFHEVLLKLTERLLEVEQFNRFYWIKQLIERGNLGVKTDAYHLLVNRLAAKEPEKAWEQVRLWLPKDKPLNKYAPSNHYACFFAIHHCVMELTSPASVAKGIFPYAIRLLQQSQHQATGDNEFLNFTLRQFMHEGTRHQFTGNERLLLSKMSLEVFALQWSKEKIIRIYLLIDDMRQVDSFADTFVLEYKPRYMTLVADIIEAWYHLIKGLRGEYTPDAKALNNFLLTTALQELNGNPTEWAAILSHWQRKPGIYMKQAERLKKRMSDNSQALQEKDTTLLDSFIENLLYRQQNMEAFFEQLNHLL